MGCRENDGDERRIGKSVCRSRVSNWLEAGWDLRQAADLKIPKVDWVQSPELSFGRDKWSHPTASEEFAEVQRFTGISLLAGFSPLTPSSVTSKYSRKFAANNKKERGNS